MNLLDDLRELFAVEHLAGNLLLPVLTNYVYHCWDSNYIYEKRVQKNTGKGQVSVNKSQVNTFMLTRFMLHIKEADECHNLYQSL